MSTQDDMVLVTRFAFIFGYSAFYSRVLAVSNDWFPFTPTFTAEPGRWFGRSDFARFFFSAVFLLLAPISYFVFVLIGLSHKPSPLLVPLGWPTLTEFGGFLALLSLAFPTYGLYGLWLAIVRRWPTFFYSQKARDEIRRKYPNAFESGLLSTFLLGSGAFGVPTLLFLWYLWRAVPRSGA